MTVYQVVSKYFDKGEVRVSFYTYEMDKKPENTYEERPNCDVYKEYFTNKKEAEKHYRQAKNS